MIDIHSYFNPLAPIEHVPQPEIISRALADLPNDRPITVEDRILKLAQVQKACCVVSIDFTGKPGRISRAITPFEQETQGFKSVVIDEDFIFI